MPRCRGSLFLDLDDRGVQWSRGSGIDNRYHFVKSRVRPF